MKIYLINLDRAVDRREHMMQELSRLTPDLDVERALCVDIKAEGWSAPSSIKPGRWKSDRWSLSSSDIEIFRSHIDCWEKIAASGEAGLILEDDLLFAESFTDAIGSLRKNNPLGIIHLDATPTPFLMGAIEQQMGGFTLRAIESLTASAAAYYMCAETASRLIENVDIERTVDDFLFDPTPSDRGARGHGLPILQLEPIVAVQAQFATYSKAERAVPSFLEVTKRDDVSSRKNREFVGPLPYRLRKEILRSLYRPRLKKRIQSATLDGGRWDSAELPEDFTWR